MSRYDVVMDIRCHQPNDYAAIAELRWILQTDDGVRAAEYDKNAFVALYMNHLARADQDGRTIHWVIEDEGDIVGVMTIRMVEKEPSPAHGAGYLGYLTNVVLAPSRRNQGLGTRLLATAISWAWGRGVEVLIVWPSAKSYSFYRRAGFTGRDDPLQLVLHGRD